MNTTEIVKGLKAIPFDLLYMSAGQDKESVVKMEASVKAIVSILEGSFVIWKEGNWKYIPCNAWEYMGDPDFLLDIDLSKEDVFKILD
jgi:hypothetical protein